MAEIVEPKQVWDEEKGWQPNPNYVEDKLEEVGVSDISGGNDMPNDAQATTEDDDDYPTEVEMEQAIKAAIAEHEDEFHSDNAPDPEATPGG